MSNIAEIPRSKMAKVKELFEKHPDEEWTPNTIRRMTGVKDDTVNVYLRRLQRRGYINRTRFGAYKKASSSMELNPWDTAAGVLIVEQAGGCVTNFKNIPFDPFMKQIIATNNRIHKSMIGILQ